MLDNILSVIVAERTHEIGAKNLFKEEFKIIDSKIDSLYEELEKVIPEDQRKMLMKYSDIRTEEQAKAIDLHYKQGFIDALKLIAGN